MGILSRLFGLSGGNDDSDEIKLELLSTYVAGTSYRQKEVKKVYDGIYSYEKYDGLSAADIKSMFTEGDRVYEIPAETQILGDCELIPEPDNEYDKNAIKVVVDGMHVGYIPKDRCSEVKKILDNIQSIDMEAYGGKYKEVYYDYDTFKEKVLTDKKDLGINLSIFYYPGGENN